MSLDVEKISCGYKSHAILTDVSFSLKSAECLCILGPNGVGKTTLFKTILNILPAISGNISVDGKNRDDLSIKDFAQRVAYVPQAHTSPFDFTVEDVVALGRTAYCGMFSSPGKGDLEIALQVMDTLGISHLRGKVFTEISGGERQMVLFARAMAQEPRYLVLDEPTSSLDFGNQTRVLEQINQLRKSGIGIIMTTHNPDHAFICGTRILLILPDHTIMHGTAKEIITEENLLKAYGIKTCIGRLSTGNGDYVETCVPIVTHGYN